MLMYISIPTMYNSQRWLKTAFSWWYLIDRCQKSKQRECWKVKTHVTQVDEEIKVSLIILVIIKAQQQGYFWQI